MFFFFSSVNVISQLSFKTTVYLTVLAIKENVTVD